MIIVLNKIREHRFGLNQGGLRQKFAGVRRFVETDCEDRTGIDELHRLIRGEIDALPNLRDPFPSAWFTIKDRLSGSAENYLTFDRYRALCAEGGEQGAEAQERLAEILHALGIALNYKDDPRLRDTHVLNPRWVAQGVYRILNHDRLTERNGELFFGDLVSILDREAYPPERHGFIVELMRKFELCFRFPEEEDHFLIPELLGKDQPEEAKGFKAEACLNFEYRHNALLPEGLLPRFIVRTHVLSSDRPRWRTGVILHLEGNEALVVADPIERCVRIRVRGPVEGRRRLLAVIRSDFERIHGSSRF